MSNSVDILRERYDVNKPGTSCLGCRRRKLKCTKEVEGCHNCTKSGLPCVYPAPETGVKRKRGPYKKDKTPHARHWDDVLKYLGPSEQAHDESRGQSASQDEGRSGSASSTYGNGSRPSMHTAKSEDLVKDALIALTRSSVSEHDSRFEDGATSSRDHASGAQATNGNHHPSVRCIFEYWHIYTSRVDPMVKVIHCPTVARKLFSVIDNLENIPPSTQALIFSIYYASVSACTAREARARFEESQDALLKRYGHRIEEAIGDSYDVPALEALQALVLYIICMRRANNSVNLKALFQLAVRSAQIIRLGEDPEGKYTPYEVECRRRLWYHLCGLENGTAEETGTRKTSLMQDHNVQLPTNLNDHDLDIRQTELPRARAGITDMTMPLMRFEIHRLIYGLWMIRKQHTSTTEAGFDGIREYQLQLYEKAKQRLDSQYLVYLDRSRPYDWMCLQFVEGMLTKARLMINFPFGTIPTREMPERERMELLRASVSIISDTHILGVDERVSQWWWYFRGYIQWHSLAIVVAELGWSTNTEFTDMAWQVLDPILSNWDVVYKTKRNDPAWEHVNTMIERARNVRLQRIVYLQKVQARESVKRAKHAATSSQTPDSSEAPVNWQTIGPHERPLECLVHNASGEGSGRGFGDYLNKEEPNAYTPSSPTAVSQPSDLYADHGSATEAGIDFIALDALEDIDFNAFDQVFNSASWEMLSPLQDINAPLHHTDVGAQAYFQDLQ